MQSSAGMKQSCTCGECNHFFPVNEEEKEKDKVEEEHKDEEKEEEEEMVEEDEEITTTMQSSAAMQWRFTRGQGNCFFPVNKVEEEEKGWRRRRGGEGL